MRAEREVPLFLSPLFKGPIMTKLLIQHREANGAGNHCSRHHLVVRPADNLKLRWFDVCTVLNEKLGHDRTFEQW